MPASCAVTGKTYRKIHKRSHSMQSTITRMKPNLQSVKVGNRRIKICTRALKSMKKNPQKLWPLIEK